MRLDPRSEGLRWLEQALADRVGAQLLFDGGSYHLACFVAQQIAEKALKAFLYAQGEEFVVGHSVGALSRWAAEFDSDFEKLRETVAPLDGYYIPTRYTPTACRIVFRRECIHGRWQRRCCACPIRRCIWSRRNCREIPPLVDRSMLRESRS